MESLLQSVRAPPQYNEEGVIGAGANTVAVVLLNITDPGGYKKLYAGQHVAMKKLIIPLNESGTTRTIRGSRIEREVAMLKSFRHPFIVSCFGVLQLDGCTLGILMEYCPGNSLRNRYLNPETGEKQPFDNQTAAKCTAQMLQGLKYLHGKGVVHRDVKGLNVLLSKDGTCKLADFGSAVDIARENDQQFHSVQGSLYWMSPEVYQLSKEQGGSYSADIWSLGCTVIEILTAEVPFYKYRGETPFKLMQHICADDEPDDNLIDDDLAALVDPAVVNFLKRCLKRDPTKRATADELLQDPWIVSNVDTSVHSLAAAAGFGTSGQLSSELDVGVLPPGAVSPGVPSTANSSPDSLALLCDKLYTAKRWWSTSFGEGKDAIPAVEFFNTLRCDYLLQDLLPIALLDPHMNCLADVRNATISYDVFTRFMTWFGPFEVFQEDVSQLEASDYASVGYNEAAGCYSSYAAADDQHLLLGLLSKPWMQPLLDQKECEDRMKNAPAGTFVIRFTGKYLDFPGGFTLTIRGDHGVNHYRILRPDDGWSFIITPDRRSRELYFDTLEELVAYFQVHGIKSQKSSTVYTLQYPLPKIGSLDGSTSLTSPTVGNGSAAFLATSHMVDGSGKF